MVHPIDYKPIKWEHTKPHRLFGGFGCVYSYLCRVCSWEWFESNGNTQEFGHYDGYENWYNDGDAGDCMGGELVSDFGVTSFDLNYGWSKLNCNYVKNAGLRAMCRLDCTKV